MSPVFELFDAGHRLTLREPPRRLRRVVIEVTTWCNLECPGCHRTQSVARGIWSNRHMPVELFRRIIQHLPPSDMAVLHGVGEPTMHPDYLTLVDIAKASGRFDRLHCNTNAMARDGGFYGELVAHGMDAFSVSIDSLDPDILALTRAGTDTDRLLARLRAFLDMGLPFYVQMVLSRINDEDIFRTLGILDGLGSMTVFIQPFIDTQGHGKDLTREMAERFLARLQERSGQWSNLRVMAPHFLNLGLAGPPGIPPMCTSPWLDPAIDVEGHLTPCCIHWQPDTLGRQSLAERPFAEIWRSEPVQRFMTDYVGASPSFCGPCSQNVRAAA